MSVLSIVLLVLTVLVVGLRFYMHRHRFAELSKGEWLKYILGFVLSVAVATAVILGGKVVLQLYLSGWLYSVLSIVLIIFGVVIGSLIFLKFIPTPVKSFYE